MPDITATRPASAAVMESAWGQQVHDAIEGIQAGTATITLAAAATGTVTVTFPRAYSAPPTVVATHAGGGGTYFVNVGPITATTVVLTGAHRAGSATSVSLAATWVAVGPPA